MRLRPRYPLLFFLSLVVGIVDVIIQADFADSHRRCLFERCW